MILAVVRIPFIISSVKLNSVAASLVISNMSDDPEICDCIPHYATSADIQPQECIKDWFQSVWPTDIMSSASLVPFALYNSMSRLQHFGETFFAATLVLATIQAALALYQYRSNPSGELVFPPGLTCGVEDPDSAVDSHLVSQTNRANDKSTNLFQQLKSLSDQSDYLLQEENEGQPPSVYTRTLFKFNRMLFLLLPWIAQQVNFFLVRNSHLFHIFLIISLGSAFDLWRPKSQQIDNGVELSIIANLGHKKEKEQKVVVIGDSLAIGIGSVDTFDVNKNNSNSIYRIEKLTRDDKSETLNGGISPVFPQVFAQTLSKRLKQRVQWRSAGVDGGDVDDIRHFCGEVVKEEAEKGDPPDIVVVICGINDLKKAISNPVKSKSGARGFQSSMQDLIRDIRQYAPNACIVFPALPVQMFHKNSVVNIFPLSFVLDTIVGFWEGQKKLVADTSPSSVMYLGLTAREILSWCNSNDGEEGVDTMLIASDGVHPNKRCYTKWAECMGNKLCDHVYSKMVIHETAPGVN